MRTALRTWGRLLDEAGGLCAPMVERLLPETRLVAVPRPDGGIDISRIARGRIVPLSADEPTGRPGRVELRLPADQLLVRSLTLPAASRDYLPTIIEHRLERLTPWRRDDVVHGFAVTATNQDGTLTVRVVLTSTAIVETALAALRARGLTPTAIGGLADRPVDPLPVVLGVSGDVRQRPFWLAVCGRIWLAGTAGLIVAAMASTLWAAAAGDRQAEAERHLAKARRLISLAASGPLDAVDPQWLAAKRPDRATVTLVDTLATALPDTAYLHEMALTPADIRLVGTAKDAPALIPILEQAGFRNVRFTAPVTRGEDRRDSFELTAERVQPTGDAP